MKETKQLTVDEFVKLLNYYKERLNLKYSEEVKNNDEIDTIEEAIVKHKEEIIQEKMDESFLEFSDEKPIEITEAEDSFDIQMNITDENGKNLTILKSNDVVKTKKGLDNTTHFATELDTNVNLLEKIESDQNLKTTINKVLTNESIELFFHNSYYLINVYDINNNSTYVLKFNLNEQYLIKKQNNQLKEVKLKELQNFYNVLTMNYEDLPVVFKRIYEDFKEYDNSLINKIKFKLRKIK